MSKNEFSELIQARLYAEEHRLLDDALGAAVRQCLGCNVVDEFVTNELLSRVQNHKISRAFAGALRLPSMKNGDILLGQDANGKPVSTYFQYFNGHSLWVGGSGSGKTTAARFLVLEAAQRVNVGLWLFDLRKREFIVLRPYLAQLGIDLHIIPGRRCLLNPLQVAFGVNPQDFAPRVADMLVQVLTLPPRATKLLHRTILNLYRVNDVFSGSRKYPTLFHLFDRVRSDNEANAPARQAILDSLEPVLLSLGPEVLGYHVGWDTRDLARRHIAFDFSGQSELDKDLLLNTLVLGEFSSRISRGVSNPAMDLYVVCDEAARLVSSSGGSQGINDLIGLVRGTGIGLHLSVQTGDVASAILSNTANKFIGRCGSFDDYNTVGSAMGLTAEQKRWMATRLGPGLFVAQIGEGDWRHPFLLKVPNLDFRVPAGMSLDEEHLGDLTRLSVVPSLTSYTDSVSRAVSVTPSCPTEQGLEALTEAELRYLHAVMEHPALPSSQYPGIARMGQRKAQQLRKQLIERGYLREHRVNTAGRGRASLVLEPLEPALLAMGKPSNSSSGRGS